MNANRIYEWARREPNKTALVYNGVVCDYSTFARAIETNRRFLETCNLPSKGTAVVAVANVADSWFVVLALRALGLDTICAPTLAAVDALNIKDATCLVVTEAEKAGQDFDRKIVRDTKLIVLPRMQPLDISPDELPANLPESGGHILYTSGTTGHYKKLMLDAATQEKRILQQIESRSLGPATIQHCGSFGLWAAAGCSAPITLWSVGGTAIIDQRPNALRHFFDHKPTRAWLTPPLLSELLDLRGKDAHPIDGFALSVGSGFLPLSLAQRTLESLTRTISMGYASSECPKIAGTEFESEEDLYWLTIKPGRTLEIVDEEGRPCPIGEEGRIRVLLKEGDCTSYLDDPETTARFFRDGYFYPGDMGAFRADGKLRVLGRAGDVLSIQGKKIPVGPLEERVQRVLGANNVCLFAGLSNDGKDELVIAIEGNHAPTAAQIKTLTEGFHQFERIRFEIMKTFPRTEAGTQKVKREELRKRVFS